MPLLNKPPKMVHRSTINSAEGNWDNADKSYVLIGVLRDGDDLRVIRTIVNSYNGKNEIEDANVLYSAAIQKKNQLLSKARVVEFLPTSKLVLK